MPGMSPWNFLLPFRTHSSLCKEHQTSAPVVIETPRNGLNPSHVTEVATAACKAPRLSCHRPRLSTSFTNVTNRGFKFRSHGRCHGFESGDPEQDSRCSMLDARMAARKPCTQIPFDHDSGHQTLHLDCCPLPLRFCWFALLWPGVLPWRVLGQLSFTPTARSNAKGAEMQLLYWRWSE